MCCCCNCGGGVAYFTDCSGVPGEAVEAAHGAEVLILDTLRDTPHPTHMNFEQALEAMAAVPGSESTALESP